MIICCLGINWLFLLIIRLFMIRVLYSLPADVSRDLFTVTHLLAKAEYWARFLRTSAAVNRTDFVSGDSSSPW